MSIIITVRCSHAGRDDYRCAECGAKIPRGSVYIAVFGSAFKGDPPYTLRYHTGCTDHRPVLKPRNEVRNSRMGDIPVPSRGGGSCASERPKKGRPRQVKGDAREEAPVALDETGQGVRR